MVCFVINQEQGQSGDDLSTAFRVMSIRNVVPYPLEQAFEYRLVLLDHEEPGALFRRDAELSGNCGIEVPLVRAVGHIVGTNGRIAVDFTDSDDPDVLLRRLGLIAEKTLVQSHLSL